MHNAVLEYVARFATDQPVSVLDIGGRDLNGTTRHLYPHADPYHVLDIRPDDGVDIVADAATWQPDRQYDLVLCTEVFEHTPAWPQILATAHQATRSGGRLVVTCAGPGREPHSAIVAAGIQPGEYYSNVHPADLLMAARAAGWEHVDVERAGLDVRATAVHP